MSETTNLLSRKGRLGQRDYWIGIGVLLGARVAMAVLAVVRPDWDFVRHGDFLMVFIAIVMGKRMRDFGWSALWAIAAVVILSFVVPVAQMIVWPHPHDPSNPVGAVNPLTGLGVSLALLVLVVALGLKRGDPGPNRFGRGPVDAKLAEQIGAF